MQSVKELSRTVANNTLMDNSQETLNLQPIKRKNKFFKRQSEVNLYAKYRLDALINLKNSEQKQTNHEESVDKQLFVRNINNGHRPNDTYYYFGQHSSTSSLSMMNTKNNNFSAQSTLPKMNENKFKLIHSKRKKIIVLYGNIFDANTVQAAQIELPNQSKDLSELYKSQEMFLNGCQEAFHLNNQFKTLYQPNMVQISFIEEIAKTFTFVIICKLVDSSYSQVFVVQVNYFKIKFSDLHQSKLINAFNQIDDIEEFRMKLKSRSFIKSVLLSGQISDISMEPDFSNTKILLNDDQKYTPLKSLLISDPIPFEIAQIQFLVNQGAQPNNIEHLDDPLEEDLKRDFIMMDQQISSDQIQKLIQPIFHKRDKPIEQPRLKVKNTDFIRRNRSKFESKINRINHSLPILQQLNIPSLIDKVGLDRKELHNVYCKFKSLLLVQSQRESTSLVIQNGIDFETFYQSLDEQMLAQREMIYNLFQNYSVFDRMDWSQYCLAVNLMRAPNLQAKMKLIMKLIDRNADGMLSFNEINEKSLKMLKKLMPSKGDVPISLSNFVTRTIFDAVSVGYKEKIKISQIKHMIEIDHPEVQLLLMICSGQ